MACVIGVDIGTQSTKALLIDADGGIIASHDASYAPDTPRPLWAEQEADVWLRAVVRCISGCVEKAQARPGGFDGSAIGGICISSLYGGSGIAVDADLKPLHPCLIWMDRRADAQVAQVRRTVDVERLLDVTANGIDSYYGFTKMLWLRDERPEVWRRTRYLLPPNAYVIAVLTGVVAVDHSSAGNIGGIYDMAARCWSTEMLETLGIPAAMMPERLVECSAVVGGVGSDWAPRLGVKAGTPVVAGGVDAAVATFAAGVTRPGEHVAMIGTSMCWGMLTPRADPRHGLVSMPYVVNGMHDTYVFGGAITAGASVSWFQEQFCQDAGAAVSLQALDQQAAQVPPGSDGVLFLPYLMGERSPIWDSRASGAFVGLNLFHRRGHLYRAVLEGVSYALRHNIEAGVKTGAALAETLIVVGGAARSDLWMQIIADVTRRPVRTIVQNVEAAFGAALLATIGVGVVSSDVAGGKWITLADRAEPKAADAAVYGDAFDAYRDLYPAIRSTMHRLQAKPAG